MSCEATISSSVLAGLRGDIAQLHIDEAELAKRCHLPAGGYSRSGADIPLQCFVAALEFAAEAAGQLDFGWQAGRRYDMRFLDDLGEALSDAPTLGAALQTFARYLRLIQSSSEFTFAVEGNHAVIGYRILDPDIWPRRQDAEFTLSFLCAMMRACLGPEWQPLYVGFEHAAGDHPARRNAELGLACDFGCDTNAIVLPVRALDKPMPGRCSGDWPVTHGHLDAVLKRRERARPMRSRVENVILAEIGRFQPGQTTIASELGLSPRSLHRRLEAEGTSYGEILADCRSRLGRFLLRHSDKPLSQVAHDLGYSDYTAFSRAFRAETGCTPKAFRDRRGPAA